MTVRSATTVRLRSLQLASQALPIGGYSHSFALEAAIESGLVVDEDSAGQWINDALSYSMLSYEVPLLCAMHEAWRTGQRQALADLNEQFTASRESAELRAASAQMGGSLRRLLLSPPESDPALLGCLADCREPSLPLAWSGAANAWGLSCAESRIAYLWTWIENQALVAIKSVPIGQSAGQRILIELADQIAAGGECAHDPDAQVEAARSNFAPGLAILSSQHETQYSRLFRS